MKKSLFILSSIFLASFLLISCNKTNSKSSKKNEVIIYTYDSFAADWGAAPKIAASFQKETGIKAVFVDCGSGGQLLSRTIIEKDSPKADIILGIDNNNSIKALQADILDSYIPQNADSIIDPNLQAQLGTKDKLIPYDYSHFTFIFDKRAEFKEPKCLADLADPIYKNKIILMDPRTSTPGLGFVAWTKAVFTDDADFSAYWQSIKPNVLTMAPGWSAGYGLFTNGEAPLVISYTTSPAANLEYDKIDYYKALVFDDGHYMQVEGAGILKNAPHRKEAELFMDFLISEKAQSALPLTQWMYPVNKNVRLPDCYAMAAAKPNKTLSVNTELLSKAAEKAISIIK